MRKPLDRLVVRFIGVAVFLVAMIFLVSMVFGKVGEVTVTAIDENGFLELSSGERVELAGINMGAERDGSHEGAIFLLDQMTRYKLVWVESNEKGQAWVWFACPRRPWFGFGCQNGLLVNEELVKAKVAVPDPSKVGVADIKYWERISRFDGR